MLRSASSVVLVVVSMAANAAGPLDDAVRDIDRWSKLEVLSGDKALKRNMLETSAAIERSSLVQSIQVSTLAQRISELEATVKTQQLIIANYEEVIAKLKAQIPRSEQ